jgi:two-component system response regulator YesN
MILIIVALLFGFIAVSYIYNILATEIQNVKSIPLKQIQMQFDAKLLEAGNLLNQIMLDDEISLSAIEDLDNNIIGSGTVLKIRNKINKMQNEAIHDIFIYYKNSDRIVSSNNTSFGSKMYFETCYASSGLKYQEFLDELQRININRTFYLGKERGYVVIAQSLPVLKHKNYSVTAVCVIKNTTTKNILEGAIGDGEITIVFDKIGNILASSNLGYALKILNEITDIKKYEGQGYFTKKINNEDCVINISSSPLTMCKYVSIASINAYLGVLSTVRLFCIVVTISFTILSLALIYLLTKKNYLPISKLVDTVKEKISPSKNSDIKNEIDFIGSFIDTALHKENLLKDLLREDFLNKAIQGEIPFEQDINETFQEHGIKLLSDNFSVILLKIETSNGNLNSYIYVIESIFKELIKEENPVFALYTADDLYTCILNTSFKSDEYIDELCKKLTLSFKNRFGITCTISYGGNNTGWQGLSQSYKEACKALEFRIIYGIGNVISYKNIIEKDFTYNFDFRKNTENLILSYIKTGKLQVDELIFQITEKCFENKICIPDEYKCFYYDMNDIIRKIIQNLRAEGLNSNVELIINLSNCEDLKHYLSELNNVFSQLRKEYLELTENTTMNEEYTTICFQVKKFIDKNYSNYDLGVSHIGSKFNMAPPYISKIFRDYEGVSIPDYINAVRHKKAKELLRDTNMPIKNIAKEIGFLSSTVFIRTFKKMESITPGTFRKM